MLGDSQAAATSIAATPGTRSRAEYEALPLRSHPRGRQLVSKKATRYGIHRPPAARLTTYCRTPRASPLLIQRAFLLQVSKVFGKYRVILKRMVQDALGRECSQHFWFRNFFSPSLTFSPLHQEASFHHLGPRFFLLHQALNENGRVQAAL